MESTNNSKLYKIGVFYKVNISSDILFSKVYSIYEQFTNYSLLIEKSIDNKGLRGILKNSISVGFVI